MKSITPPIATAGVPPNVKRALNRAFLLPIAVMIALGGVFVYQTRALLALSAWVDHTDQVIASTQQIARQVIELESSYRGFLLSGNPDFLEPYHEAEKLLPTLFDRIIQLLADNPPQQERVGEIQSSLGAWQEGSRRLIREKRNGKDVLPEIQAQGPRKQMMKIRGLFASLVLEEERLRDERRKEVESRAKLTITAAILLALFWGTLLALGTRRQITAVSAGYEKLLDDLAVTQGALQKSHEELELRVAERTAALITSNAELEAFSYSVSHDLRSPLRGIDGFSQALLEDYGGQLDSKGKQYLTFVRQGVQKMGKLIDDLLDLSRVSRVELKRENVSLDAIAAGIIAGLRELEPTRQVEFRNLGADEGKVEGDSGLLHALLENLLSNAWKFTSKKATALIELSSMMEGDKRVFFVRDNGAGFDMAFSDKLFGAFQRLHAPNEFHGTGVGLATVRRIVHRHGGKVWAEGHVGEGATFFFTLI